AGPDQNYRALCAPCHGGKAEGARGPALAVAKLNRANDAAGIVSLVRQGIPGTEMPATAASRLGDDELRELASWVLKLRENPAALAEASLTTRGHELFARYGCANCHSIQGSGGALGPDLSDIGLRRAKAQAQ